MCPPCAPLSAGCLPHDPLFQLLQVELPPLTRSSPTDVAAALVGAASRAATLMGASSVEFAAECSPAAMALPWGRRVGDTGRQQSSAVATPAAGGARLAAGKRQRAPAEVQHAEGQLQSALAAAAHAPHTVTPRQAPGGSRACKRLRILLSAPTGLTCSSAPGPRRGAAPDVRACGDSCALPQRQAGLRVVARDLSFTPAPPARQPIAAGKPVHVFAAAAQRCSAAALMMRRKQVKGRVREAVVMLCFLPDIQHPHPTLHCRQHQPCFLHLPPQRQPARVAGRDGRAPIAWRCAEALQPAEGEERRSSSPVRRAAPAARRSACNCQCRCKPLPSPVLDVQSPSTHASIGRVNAMVLASAASGPALASRYT